MIYAVKDYLLILKYNKFFKQILAKLYETEGTIPLQDLALATSASNSNTDSILVKVATVQAVDTIINAHPSMTRHEVKEIFKIGRRIGIDNIQEYYRAEAESKLERIKGCFRERKAAYLKNPDSDEGIRYFLENRKKAPVATSDIINYSNKQKEGGSYLSSLA